MQISLCLCFATFLVVLKIMANIVSLIFLEYIMFVFIFIQRLSGCSTCALLCNLSITTSDSCTLKKSLILRKFHHATVGC